jgi:hypothetical protein
VSVIDPAISQDEVAAMLAILDSEIDKKPLLALRLRGDRIEAKLGVRESPRFAHGTILTLRKIDGCWEVERRASWIT